MDDTVNNGPAREAGLPQGRSLEDEFLRELEVAAGRRRRREGNPLAALPLHRLLAYGRDHGPQAPGLAEAVGEALAGDMLEDGLSEERQLAAVRAVGERALADGRLLGLAPWPDQDDAEGTAAPAGCHGRPSSAPGQGLADGLPLAKRVEWHSWDADSETTPCVEVSWDRAAEEVARRAVEAHERLEGKLPCLWTLPRATPPYLEPREAMRFGQTLADPVLREMVERAWDAMVMLHLTVKANSHPSSREDARGRWEDHLVDSTRLRSLTVKVGERLLSAGGVALLEGLRLEFREDLLAKLGEVLVESCYVTGTYRIRTFDALWVGRDWDGLVREYLLSSGEAEELRLWTNRDYRGLLARGTIDAAMCEWYEKMDQLDPPRE